MKQFNKKWLQRISSEPASPKDMDRRTFLIRGGVALGSGALMGLLPLSCVRQATEEEKKNFPRPDVADGIPAQYLHPLLGRLRRHRRDPKRRLDRPGAGL